MEKKIITQEITNWLRNDDIKNRLDNKNIIGIAFHHLVRCVMYPIV